MKIAELFETVQPLPGDMPVEHMLEELEKRLAASKRGLGFANRMRNPLQQKKHRAAVMKNLNIIRNQLNRVIAQMEQFNNAESDHENASDDVQDFARREPTSVEQHASI